MPFCPNCGLNLSELGAARDAGPGDAAGRRAEELDAAPSSYAAQRITTDEAISRAEYAGEGAYARAVEGAAAPAEATRAPSARPADRLAPAGVRTVRPAAYDEPAGASLPGPVLLALLIAGVIVVLALNSSGLLRVPGGTGIGGAVGTATPSPTPAGPTFAPTSAAPPVGLAILSPTNGAVVGSKQIVVIGSAPAGLRVVRDVPLWIDQSTTSDGTGHWAMTVDLNSGENKLRFRLGDDKTTAKEIRVTYSPPGG
jgi:hypothetical protein